METGLDKSSSRIPSDLTMPMAIVCASERLSTPVEQFKCETQSRSFILLHSSEELETIFFSSARQLSELGQSPIVKPLAGHIKQHGINPAFIHLREYFKYVKDSAKAMLQFNEYKAELAKIHEEHKRVKKERQKEKCAVFWEKAEDLFHRSFVRLCDERVRIATKDIPLGHI